MPGPIPKRSSERRRRNLPEPGRELRTETVAGRVKPPAASRDWHPIARKWYASLRTSGQARFYEPSDWAYAQLVAQLMSDGLTRGWGSIEGKSGVQVQAVLSAMAPLLVTEGDRRRARLEIERVEAEQADAPDAADKYRARLGIVG